jgi:glycerol transport system permease protein
MVNMSFKTNDEILAGFTLFPQHFTWDNYKTIFTDPSLVFGLHQQPDLRGINTVISLTVALPAAYAFSRYSFLGDKHLFFWLLTNRMTPPAVFALPFFQLYSSVGLIDTHIAVALAHLPVQRAAGGVDSGRLHERRAARNRRDRLYRRLLFPALLRDHLHAADRKAGIGVAAFFCFMFSWVELLLARTLTSVNAKPIAATMTRTVSPRAWTGACWPRPAC